MDLKKLYILLAVARTGSFTAAADRVHLTQSAVSQQMALLENEVKEPLFERGRRGVKLTSFALQLCEAAEPVVFGAEQLSNKFRRRTGGQRSLRIGAFPTAGNELLPKAIRIFREGNPNTQIIMRNINLESPEIALDAHEIDLILSFHYGPDINVEYPGVRKIDLFQDALLAILPSDHPLVGSGRIELMQLAGECWVFHRHANSYRNVYSMICSRAGFNPELVFYVDDFHTLQGLIAERIGVSIAPQLSLIPRRDGVAILPFEPKVARNITVLTRKEGGANQIDINQFVLALEQASKFQSFKQV